MKRIKNDFTYSNLIKNNFLHKSFELSDCRDSYKEFISLIHLIYLYNSTTTSANKKKIKTRYLKLSKELNYSYFSEDFLLKYFD